MDETTKKPETPTQRSMFAQALGFAWDFGAAIALPLVAFGIGGRWLDRHFGTSPWFLLGGLLFSVGTSITILVLRLGKIIEKITKK